MRRTKNPFTKAVDKAISQGQADAISDRELQEVFTAAVRLGFAKLEAEGRVPELLDAEAVSATEVVVAVSEMIRAANLNLLDVAMWFRRPLPSA
ncbi:MAG: hypothetical protein JNM79_14570 [Burkholderiales bacterium]|nr:hypothetical protein [Burkholderiales bacterium]